MKFCVPWPFKDKIIGETFHILNALKKRKDIELTDNFDDADYIFFCMDIYNCFNCPWYPKEYFNEVILNNITNDTNFHKHVIIDYNDFTTTSNNVEDKKLNKVFKYFKRSMVDRKKQRLLSYPREIIPIMYAIRDDFIEYDKKITTNYKYDICCLFPKNGNSKRNNVVKFIDKKFRNVKKYIGYVHNSNIECYYTNINTSYYDILKNSKIIITCNPDNQEGDFRLWEALLTGNLVLCDDMIIPKIIENPLENKKHLIFYNNFEQLYKEVNYYLSNNLEREKIGKEGREYCLKYHTFDNRIDFILRKITHNV